MHRQQQESLGTMDVFPKRYGGPIFQRLIIPVRTLQKGAEAP